MSSKIKEMKESSQINQYKKICRLAGVPKLIIENPHFIESEKPTANDIEWAKKTIKQQEEYCTKFGTFVFILYLC